MSLPARGAADETATWLGGVGNWSDAGNWVNVPAVPAFPNDGNLGKTYDAVVKSGVITLDQGISIQGLTFADGTITGTSSLTLSGASAWNGGSMTGGGTTHVNAGASLGLTGITGSPTLNGRTLELAGSATDDAQTLVVENSGAVNVLSGGSLALQGGLVTYVGGNTPGALSVQAGGTLTRSGASYAQTGVYEQVANAGVVNVTQGTLNVQAAFNSTGAVQVQGGQLILAGGGSASGSIALASGAGLTFAADYALMPGASISSGASSAVSVTGGALTIGTDIAVSNLALDGGTIKGSGTLTLSGATTWSRGTMTGAGSTRVAAGASMAITGTTGSPMIDGRTLELAGSATDDASTLVVQNGGAVNVLSGGSLALRGGLVTYAGGNTPGALNVQAGGTLTRSGATYAQTGVYATLNNAGLVNVTQGTLNLQGAFNNSGAVTVNGGQLLLGAGGTATGSFGIADGAALTFAVNYSLLPGASIVSSPLSTLAVTGGTLTVGADVAVSNLSLDGGTIAGAGKLTLSGSTTWSRGTMSGAGVTRITSGATLAMTGTTGSPTVEGRTLELAGSATDDAPTLVVQNGGVLNVQSGGALALRGGLVSYVGGATPGVLNVEAGGTLTRSGTNYPQTSVYVPVNNAGLVRVAQGILTTQARFNNVGAVQVQGGALILAGGGSASGSFAIASGAGLTFASDYALMPGASIASAASSAVSVTGGTLTLTTDLAASNLTLGGGTIAGPGGLALSGTSTWSAGTMAGAGVTHLNAGAVLNMTGATGSPTLDGRTLEVGGSATDDAPTVVVQNGGAVNVLSGGSLALRGSQVSYVGGATPGVLNVQAGGTLTRTGTNYPTTAVVVPLNNAGAVNVVQGKLALLAGGSSSGTFDVATGTTLEFDSNFTLGEGATLAGTGTYAFASSPTPTLTLAGNATVATSLALAALNVDGPGDLTLQGNVTYGGGSLAGAGRVVVGNTGSLALGGAADKALTRRVDNSGTLTWSDGKIVLNGVTLNNLAGGVFSESAANSVVSGGGSPAVNNSGQFSKTSSSITIFAVPFNNLAGGNVDVAGGTLVLSAGGLNQSAITVAKGATARVSGSFAQAPGSTFDSQGNVAFEASTVTIDGNLFIDGELSFSTATASVKGGVNVTKLGLVNTSASVAAGGVLQVNAGGISFGGTGTNVVVLQPSDTTPGSFLLKGDVSYTATDGTARLNTANFGAGQLPGTLDLGGATRTFAVNDGLAAVDLSVSARVVNGAVVKGGAGTLRLEGANAYAGGTTVTAGTLEVTDPAGLGTGGVTIGDASLSLKSDEASPALFASNVTVTGDATIRVDHLTAGAIGAFRLGEVSVGGTRLTVTGANRTLAIGSLALSGSPTIDTAVPLEIDGAISESVGGLGITKSGGMSKLTFGGTAANTYTGVTRVNAGTLELNKAVGTVSVPGDLSVFGGRVTVLSEGQIAAGTHVTVANGESLLDLGGHAQTVASLSVTGGKVAVGTGAGGGVVLRVNGALALAGGATLDLGNNRLIVDYTEGEVSPITSIRAALASGYAGGNWNGAGIDSAGITPGKSLGFAEASEALGVTGGSFGGEGVDGSAVLVRYTLAGDANLDGVVDFNDLVRLAQNYNTTLAGASTWYRGDFNYDGGVDFNDLVRLAQNYNTALPAGVAGAPVGFEADVARAFAAVPEPGGGGGMGVGLLWGMRRGRRLATAGKPAR
jgi:autotransporter-associated beta strand protein